MSPSIKTRPRPDALPLRIGIIIIPTDPYWIQALEAIIHTSQKIGDELVVLQPATSSEAFRSIPPEDLVDHVLAHGLDALICAIGSIPILQALIDEKLPVICLDEIDLRHPFLTVASSLYEGGKIAGEYIGQRLGGKGHALCINAGQEEILITGQSRLSGFYDGLRPYVGISADHIPAFWRYDQTYPALLAALKDYPRRIDAIFGVSDTLILAARDAGRKLGVINDQTVLVGLNGDPLALAAIAEGSLAATVDTTVENLGATAANLAHQAALGMPLPAVIPQQFQLITQENVASVATRKLTAIADIPTHMVGYNRQQEQDRLSQLETSMEITRQIGSLQERNRLAQVISQFVSQHYGYDWVRILRWSEADQKLVLFGGDISPASKQVPVGQDQLLCHAYQSNEIVFIPDTRASHRWPIGGEFDPIRARAVLPIQLGSKVIGVMDLQSARPVRQPSLEIVGLKLLASQLGIAIENTDLYLDALHAREAAERADQLKTRLLANVSHELRTPLNVILGYSQSALASPNPYGIDLPPELRRDLGRIYSSGEHLMRLINDLLDLSRAEIDELSLVPETIAPRTFLEEVFHSIADKASTKQVAWLINLPERLPLIQADPVRLRQILLNLLANARKFTTTGHILLGAEVEPPHLHIWVEDTGIGIPVDQQERIFEPFVTVEGLGRRSEGVGLGLAVTRRLVALHRGSMTLESQVGRGSTFHVYLPLPSLTGQPVAAPVTAQPVLLRISTQVGRTLDVDELRLPRGWRTANLCPGDNLDQVLAEVRPMALAWDMAHASSSEWMLVQQIRNHPQLCQLPFILFGREQEEECGSSVTGVVTKPLGGQTLADMIEALHPPEMSGSILIVDDDPQARALYQSIVARALPGYPIRVADGGPAAMAVLAHEIPALVILDLIMPEVDGFSVLEKMRADRRTCQVPVLVISGHILSAKDIQCLDHAQVVFQSKDILSEDETATGVRRVLLGEDVLPQPTSTLVKLAIAHIQQNHAQRLSRQQIANAIGVSEDYLGRIFQQELGLSPIEYLNRYRIKEAKVLLCHSYARITDIAAQVGFDDPAYFSRAFRKQVGLSPRAYRKQPAQL